MSDKFSREQRVNRNLTIAVAALAISLLAVVVLAIVISRPLTIEVLPDTGSIQSLNSGESQPHNAFGVATLVLMGVNTWEEDGELEYKENIRRYRHFIDEDFSNWLIADYNRRRSGNNINELESRTRRLTLGDQFYKPSMVTRLSSGSFEVTLEMEVQEKLGGLLIKHYKGNFKVFVARMSSPRDANPWQLRVVGKPIEIERLETFKS